MKNNSLKQKEGFTLVELMVALAIIGVLLVIAVPLANSYRMRAEYANIVSTLRYLMDGQETYFLDKDSFYPAGSGSVTINQGQEMEIYELAYNFPAGHKHRFVITSINMEFEGSAMNYYLIYAYADFDRNGNGQNDIYIAMTFLNDYAPVVVSGTKYYRLIQQFQ